jgi:thymidylate synthase (FAD)
MKLLDHGYLEYVEHWGSDQAVIEAARQSTDKGFLGWGPHHESNCEKHNILIPTTSRVCSCKPKPGDEKLLRYLWENQHSTPFEFGGLTIEVQAPIVVFREWHRHRVPFGYSELSARYTPMPDLNYMPTVERIVEGSKKTTNKQASSVAGECSESDAKCWLTSLWELYKLAEDTYQQGLALGVPKELARLPVPVGRYSRMRATGNLRGWLAFCNLRCAPTAQWEIRQYANAVGELLSEHFPRTMELFNGPR